jgi:magnesium-transporting ATPase (P-type)
MGVSAARGSTVTGAVMAISLLLLFWGSLQYFDLSVSDFANDYDSYSPDARLVLTMMFTTFVFQQLLNVFNARTESESIFSRRMPNRSLTLVVLGLFVIQLFVVLFDPIQSIFRTVDLSAVQILICLGIAAVVVVTEELRKAIDRMVLARSGS